MSRKQKIVLAGFAVFIFVAAAGITVALGQRNRTQQQRPASRGTLRAASQVQDGVAGTLRETTPDSISLNGNNQMHEEANSQSMLKVANGSATDPMLGTQQTTQQSTNTNNSNSPAPTESFSQYDQYKDKTEVYYADPTVGTGAVAEQNKKVAVVYKGWLTDGTLFDQSQIDKDGKLTPFVVTLGAGQVIKGWDIGLVGMKVGGIRRLIIPPSLGYGDTGAANIIPPNAVMIFDVQLVAVE